MFSLCYSFNCPVNCENRTYDNITYCDCPSNWYYNSPIDVILLNMTTENETVWFTYTSENYTGNISACLYFGDTFLKNKTIEVVAGEVKKSFFDIGLCGEDNVTIELNCNYDVIEKNYTNNKNKLFVNIECASYGSSGYYVPENQLYTLIVLIIGTFYILTRKKD